MLRFLSRGFTNMFKLLSGSVVLEDRCALMHEPLKSHVEKLDEVLYGDGRKGVIEILGRIDERVNFLAKQKGFGQDRLPR